MDVVGLDGTDGDPDCGPGGGEVTHTDTFHTGRPFRAAGVSQVTCSGRSNRDLVCSSEERFHRQSRPADSL